MPPRALTATLLTVAYGLLVGCGTPIDRDCSSSDTSAAEALPELLSQTGLYAEIPGDVVADAVLEFEPRFPLWTDGADKRRWLLLPDGGQVDTSNPAHWVFPVGTRLFKEFALDGVRLETRMTTRTEGGWTAVSYVWSEGGDDAVRELDGAPDVADTPHDVPSAAECLACHAGRGNFTLGFSATQLRPQTRADLHDAGVLSDAVAGEIDLPPTALAGLGVLHGNCSHCHNPQRDEQPQATTCFAPNAAEDDDEPVDFTLPHGLASVDDAPVLQTARWLLNGGADSEVLERMSERNRDAFNPSMPPLGTEIVDPDGLAAVEAFLAELPAQEL